MLQGLTVKEMEELRDDTQNASRFGQGNTNTHGVLGGIIPLPCPYIYMY